MEVVVAFVDDGGHYPRADRKNPTLSYWKAIAVMATTLRVVGMDWPVTVSTNRPPLDPTVRRVLEKADVDFRNTPFDHRPPAGWFDRFTGSLYLLDALADAVAHSPSGSRIMVVDPDCVWVRRPDPLLEVVDRDPQVLLAYEISYPSGQPALGLTRRELGTLFREAGTVPIPEEPPYPGGEFLFGTRERLAEMLPHAQHIWAESLERFQRGEHLRVRTEEHVLGFALAQLGWTGGTANPWVRRLWTRSPPDRNIQGDEQDLVLWHALAEKKRGFLELFRDIDRGHRALSEPGPRYRRHLARRMRADDNPLQLAKQQVNRGIYRLRRSPREWPVEW